MNYIKRKKGAENYWITRGLGTHVEGLVSPRWEDRSISYNTCIAGIIRGLRYAGPGGSLFGFLRRGTRGPLWRSTGFTGFPQNNVRLEFFHFFARARTSLRSGTRFSRSPVRPLGIISFLQTSDRQRLPEDSWGLRDNMVPAQGVVLQTPPCVHGRRLASTLRSNFAAQFLRCLYLRNAFSRSLHLSQYLLHFSLF